MRSARRGCRTDDKISVPALSKPGFELQWKAKLDNQPRGVNGLGQGVTASGVTLFVPMSLVAGSSNNVYAIDNDLGYVVWQRHFDAALPAPTAECPGGITAGATRIVRLDRDRHEAARRSAAGRGAVGYRSLLGEPGEGVPVGGTSRRGARTPAIPRPRRRRRAGARGAAQAAAPEPPPAPPPPRGRGGQVPVGSHSRQRRRKRNRTNGGAYGFGFLFRPSGVGYVDDERRHAPRARPAVGQGHAEARAVPAGQRALVRRRSRWTRRCTPRRPAAAAARRTASGRSISTATRSRSCRGRPTAGRSSAPWRSPPTAR